MLLQYVFGRLVDKVTPAPVLRAGLVVFAIGGLSLALPLMPGMYALSRVLQGAGAGAAEVAALAAVGVVVPSTQRGRAFASIYGSQLARHGDRAHGGQPHRRVLGDRRSSSPAG